MRRAVIGPATASNHRMMHTDWADNNSTSEQKLHPHPDESILEQLVR